MHKFRLLPFNSALKSVRRLHQAEANVLRTSIDKNSTEYQVNEAEKFPSDDFRYQLHFSVAWIKCHDITN